MFIMLRCVRRAAATTPTIGLPFAARTIAQHIAVSSSSSAASAGIRFRHADGSDYGQSPEPIAVDLRAKAFAALRGLGFREGEVRRALAESG
jgi:hypothetical protein